MTTPNERLKQARISAGFDTAALAARAMGIPVGTYAGHENGHRGFPAARAPMYSRKFKVSEEWLLYGKGEPHERPREIMLPVALPSADRLTTMMRAMLTSVGRAELADEYAERLARLLPSALAGSVAELEPEDLGATKPRALLPQPRATKNHDSSEL